MNRESAEPQQAKKQLNVQNYRSTWPSVTNLLKLRCRTAELQCDQKVNRGLSGM